MAYDLKGVLANWNIDEPEIKELQGNVWEVNNQYILKVKQKQSFVRNLGVYNELRSMGIPAPKVLLTCEESNHVEIDGAFYFLYERLDGHHMSIDDVVANSGYAYSVGKFIGELHKAFKKMTPNFELYDNDYRKELEGWISKEIQKQPESFTFSIYQQLLDEFSESYESLERHMIHRDMHLGNLLVNDDKFTGYIDFDLTQKNVKIFDIAYITVGWLVGKMGDQEFVENWIEAVRQLIKGYDEIAGISQVEKSTILNLMCNIEVLFVAYFYRSDNMNCAHDAEKCLKWLWENRHRIQQQFLA